MEIQIQKLLKAELIISSYNPYTSPITLVYNKDKNAKTKVCTDYRKINSITKVDSESIPRIYYVNDLIISVAKFATDKKS